MALDKVTYVDNTTVIHAQNLNDIQDEIISNGNSISSSKIPTVGYTKEVYVDATNGSDDNTGDSGFPFKTLGRALNPYMGNNSYDTIAQYVIYLAEGEYEYPYRTMWQGCPHIFKLDSAVNRPKITFTIDAGSPPRFYSPHVSLKGLEIDATNFNGLYFEGSAVSIVDCKFDCAIEVVGGSVSILDSIFEYNKTGNTPFDTQANLCIISSSGSVSDCEFTSNKNMPAIYIEKGADITIVQGFKATTTASSVTKSAIQATYATLRTNQPLSSNVSGYAHKVQLATSIMIMTVSSYNALHSDIQNSNSIITTGAIDLRAINNAVFPA